MPDQTPQQQESIRRFCQNAKRPAPAKGTDRMVEEYSGYICETNNHVTAATIAVRRI
jgi:hypothetical protein